MVHAAMSYGIRYNAATGQILGAGFCDFTAELQPGEAQADSGSDTIPRDILLGWQYDAKNGLQRRAVALPDPAIAAQAARKVQWATAQTPAQQMQVIAAALGLT